MASYRQLLSHKNTMQKRWPRNPLDSVLANRPHLRVEVFERSVTDTQGYSPDGHCGSPGGQVSIQKKYSVGRAKWLDFEVTVFSAVPAWNPMRESQL